MSPGLLRLRMYYISAEDLDIQRVVHIMIGRAMSGVERKQQCVPEQGGSQGWGCGMRPLEVGVAAAVSSQPAAAAAMPGQLVHHQRVGPSPTG